MCSVVGCQRQRKAKGLCSTHYNKAYYAERAEQMRERARRWYKANPEKAAAQRRRRDPETLRALARRHYWANRLDHVAAAANQKARRLGLPGVLTAKAIADRFAYFGHRCWRCGGEGTTVDHVLLMGFGGPNWPSNVRPACGPCNFSRSRPEEA